MLHVLSIIVAMASSLVADHTSSVVTEFEAKQALCLRWANDESGGSVDDRSYVECIQFDEPIFGFSHHFSYPTTIGRDVVERVEGCGGIAVLNPDPNQLGMVRVTVSDWLSLYHLSSDGCDMELTS